MKTRSINSLASVFNNLKTTVCIYFDSKGKRLTHTFSEHLTDEQAKQRLLMDFHVPSRCIKSIVRTGASDDVAIIPSTWMQPFPSPNWENTVEANLARQSIIETCPA